jgi:hypothetical protein
MEDKNNLEALKKRYQGFLVVGSFIILSAFFIFAIKDIKKG